MGERPVIIFGAGGHARVIASLLGRDAQFVDLGAEPSVLADREKLLSADVYLGIGDNAVRRRLFERLIALGADLPPFVAPAAFVAPGAQLGRAAVILPGVMVMTGAHIGDNCIVDLGSTVDHDCMIGSHTFIGPGVTIPGEVVIGARCFFGVKSATFLRVKIGDDVTVRGGSLVTKDVAPGAKVGGIPAVRI